MQESLARNIRYITRSANKISTTKLTPHNEAMQEVYYKT
jgi:hypothetical protein